eukprot:CAMPEP_0115511576 /NCGR_PEP_ID=MMETSP0271-20121206/74045_1 /TAXON_ID=71861 /ORGANISM="Scrippsiella trochoidea, Strain CCMP3099" /LENGTH=51 /DNA_ID=CAMNT_0002941667 /DNA_START=70 /DNA_END=222 /DNA_ORIENTATION=-
MAGQSLPEAMRQAESVVDADPKALSQSIEELQLESEIRALEMEIGLLDLRR